MRPATVPFIEPTRDTETGAPPTRSVSADGTVQWRVGSSLHRLDGPAVIRPCGTEQWWVHGLRHRLGGPAVFNRDTGSEQWWVAGEQHRTDGPSTTTGAGETFWYLNGQPHRGDGPAIIRRHGPPQYWWHGERVLDSQNILSTLPVELLQMVLELWIPGESVGPVARAVLDAHHVPDMTTAAR